MRKLICIFVSVIFSLELFADCNANVEAHIRAPRQFFGKLAEIVRTVYPDPKLQIQTSFALMPFGFPKFNGISPTDDALICVYNIDSETPIIATALKLEENSTTLIEQALQGVCKIAKENGYLFVVFNANSDSQNYIDATKKLISEKQIPQLANIKLDKIATKLLFRNDTNKFLNDVDFSILKITDNRTQLEVSLDLHFEKNSDSEKIVNAVKRLPVATETQFIPQDSELVAISKIKLPQDFPDIRKEVIDSIFAKNDADKIKDMYIKNDGSFAMAINFGKDLQMTSVGATMNSQADLLDFAKNNPSIKYNANAIELVNKIDKANDIDFVESYISLTPDKKNYSAIENGYAVCTTNLDALQSVINKIKSHNNTENYPLCKYARDDSDFIVLLNNKSILNSLLAPTGAKIKDNANIENTIISADIGLGKIKIFTRVDLQVLKYYCDIYKK